MCLYSVVCGYSHVSHTQIDVSIVVMRSVIEFHHALNYSSLQSFRLHIIKHFTKLFSNRQYKHTLITFLTICTLRISEEL
jgi:hypothetical protein